MKKWISTLVVILSAGVVSAADITSAQAKKAVGTWVKSRPAAHMTATFGAGVGDVETVSVGETNLFHIVTLDDGGFVITSTDDRIQPIIAFSDSGTLEKSADNPMWVMLHRDLPGRLAAVRQAATHALAPSTASPNGATVISATAAAMQMANAEWADLLSDDSASAPAGTVMGQNVMGGKSSISDVRVSPLIQTKWSQSYAGGNRCYNYYTPHYYVCGCVATAGAQLMKYWAYPTASVSAKTFSCWVGSTVTDKQMYGGTYAWSSMPDSPGSSTSESSRQAIGKLCYDVGVATRMRWTSSESGACPAVLAQSLVDVFGYASAKCHLYNAFNEALYQRSIYANLDAKCPVLLGIYGTQISKTSSTVGHEIVADGYGVYNSVVYTHLNMGWAGLDDAWYALPTIYADGNDCSFTTIGSVVYNVFTSETGELLTGRITDLSGDPIAGVSVSCVNGATTKTTTSDAKGIYALKVTGGKTWSVTASKSGYLDGSLSVSVSTSSSSTLAALYAGSYKYYLDGKVGNSWGNDFALTPEVHSADLQIKKCLLSNVSTTQSAVSGVTTFKRGESIYAYVVVGNDGDAATEGTVWVTHEISPASSEPASTMIASSLAVGETAALTAAELPMLQGLGVGTHTYTATVDGDKTASVTFVIEEPEAELQSVVVNGASSVAAGLSETYTCRATLADGTVVTAEPVWTIDSGSAYASIDQNGVLRAANTEVARSVVIRATCIYNGVSKSGTKTVSIAPSVSLNTALDNDGLVFSTDASNPWFGQTEESYDGVDAARSAGIAHSETSWFETTVSGSGTLSFWYKVSSEENYDKLVIACDGEDMNAFSGECDWSQYTIEFTGSSEHTVRWSYVKDVSRVDGSDAAWVDQVVWTAAVTPVGLSIAGDSSVPAGGSISLAAIARMSDGTDVTVTDAAVWSIVSGGDYASVSDGGMLTAFASTEDHDVTVRAEYASGAITKSAEKTVRVVGVLPAPGKPVITKAAGDGGAVTLEWSEAEYAETYSVLRTRGGGDEETLASGLNDLAFNDTDALPGLTYHYRVVAVNDSGTTLSETEDAHRLVELSAEVSTLSFEAAGGSETVSFKANAGVSVSIEQTGDWLSSDTPGSDSVTVSAVANQDSAERMATLTLTAGQDTEYPQVLTIGVVQQGVSSPTDLPDLAFCGAEDTLPLYTTSQKDGETETLMDVGSSFYVYYGWINQGDGAAKGTVTNSFGIRTATDEELVSSRQGFDEISLELSKGYSCSIQDPEWKSLPVGVYRVLGLLDCENALAESDKDNNSAVFRFALRDSVSLKTALDCDGSSLTFTTKDDQWYGTKGLGFDGVDCAMTKLLGDGGTNTLTTTLTGAGTFSFSYRVSTEAGYDVFRFLADGIVKVQESGEGEWKTVSLEVAAGTHTFQWIYGKDAVNAQGDDCVYLDQVVWTPARSGEPPSDFAATDGSYYSYVKLTWADIADAKSYVVERAETSEGHWTVVVAGAKSSPAYDESGLGGVEYLYRIKAVYADGESDWSTPDSGWRKVDMQSCSSRTVSGVGGADAISKKANCIWKATVDCNWLTFDCDCGTNDFKLVYRFPYNDTGAERSCKVTITGSPDTTHSSTRTFTVTQRMPADNGTVIGINEATECTLNFSNSSDAPWFGQTRITHDGKHAMRSAEISGNATSRVEVALSRAGTLTFWWGTSSESSDVLSCLVGGVQKVSLSGYSTSSTGKTNVCNWAQVSLEIPQGGAVVAWEYVKDGSYDRGLDAGYVSEIVWTPTAEEIVPPQAWFDKYPGLLTRLGVSDLAAAAKMQSPGDEGSSGKTAADGSDWLVWMDYVCGTDPLDSDSKFTATIEMVDGVPKIGWSPMLSEEETKLRNYLVGGKKKLGDTSWTPVAEGHEGEFNFFNVSVEMQ